METFHEYLESGLEAKGWSRYRLAKELGISGMALQRLYYGQQQGGLSEDVLRRIAQVLELDGDRLVVLSGSLYREGSLRYNYSKLLGENLSLRSELARLREERGAIAQ